jgi:hypothetical protein
MWPESEPVYDLTAIDTGFKKGVWGESRLAFESIVEESGGLWHVCLPPTRRPDWLVVRGVSQRFEIKRLKFFRFSDHPLLLSVSVI